ncbi:MAG TPA: hypothetical protein VFH98_02920, partial [Candidatus Limnocylindria bacterium]|nr:hypothetical protein [Candidatus Limnocylindria bacterium]
MISRVPIYRALRIVVAGMLLTTAFSATAMAKPPKYGGDVVETPATFVSYGKLVRFDVTWINQSGANLPHVFVKADNATGGTFVALVAGPSQGTCGIQTPELFQCSFGTVNNGASVTFSVVYRAPSTGTSYSQKFLFTAQGST